MIDTNYDLHIYSVVCDCCGQEVDDFDIEDGWDNMIAEIKLLGWKFKREEDGTWIHQCHECYENKVEW